VEGKKDEWIVKILRAIKVPGYKSHNYYLRTPYIPAIADEELKGQRIEDVVNRWHAKVRETVQERGGNKPLDDLLDEANLDIPCSPLASAHELFETVISIHAHRIHRIPISEHCLPGGTPVSKVICSERLADCIEQMKMYPAVTLMVLDNNEEWLKDFAANPDGISYQMVAKQVEIAEVEFGNEAAAKAAAATWSIQHPVVHITGGASALTPI
jgi:hypothetical protein